MIFALNNANAVTAESPSGTEEKDLLGQWYLTEILDETEARVAGIVAPEQASLLIQEGGTATMIDPISNSEQNLSWVPDGEGIVITFAKGASRECEIEGGRLLLKGIIDSNYVGCFDRVPVSVVNRLADVSVDKTAEDFFGSWICNEIEYGNLRMWHTVEDRPIVSGNFGPTKLSINEDRKAIFYCSDGSQNEMVLEGKWRSSDYELTTSYATAYWSVRATLSLRGEQLVWATNGGDMLLIFDRE